MPSPNESRSLPAAMAATTPAEVTFSIAAIVASFAGSISGPPRERLMTFIPSAAAASMPATISGVSPESSGAVSTR